jgi:hypothetical protein
MMNPTWSPKYTPKLPVAANHVFHHISDFKPLPNPKTHKLIFKNYIHLKKFLPSNIPLKTEHTINPIHYLYHSILMVTFMYM